MSDASILTQASTPQGSHEKVWQQIAEFIAKAELTKHQGRQLAQPVNGWLQKKNRELDEKLMQLHQEMREIKGVMARTDSIRLLNEIDHLRQENDREIQQLQHVYQQSCQQISQSCDQMNYSSMRAIKQISQIVNEAKHQDIQTLQQQKIQDVRKTCQSTLGEVDRLGKSFHWKTLGIIMLLTLVVSVLTSLYIDDEWPWQMHAQVAKERQVGDALLKEWTHLNPQDQQLIIDYA